MCRPSCPSLCWSSLLLTRRWMLGSSVGSAAAAWMTTQVRKDRRFNFSLQGTMTASTMPMTMSIPRSAAAALAAWLLLVGRCDAFAPAQTAASLTISSTGPKSSPSSLALGDFFNFNKNDGDTAQQEVEAETSEAETAEAAKAKAKSQAVEEEDQDPVEKIFGFFFGAKEEKPMGMDRFGPERFPEQYPAVKDEWAEPLEGDDAEMAKIRPFLKNTNLERRALRLTYDANRDGWDPVSFHGAVDKKGGAVVLCTTRMGIECGGYNPKGWVGYGEARGSIAAFLFQIGGRYREGDAPGIKLQKVGGPGLAQMDMPENGPSFGADSLVIPLGDDNPKLARSKLGSYYERLPDGTNSLFGKDASVQLRDLRVYHGVYEEGEYIPFTDAEPFALY